MNKIGLVINKRKAYRWLIRPASWPMLWACWVYAGDYFEGWAYLRHPLTSREDFQKWDEYVIRRS